MPRQRILNTGCSVYWGRVENSITPCGEPIYLEFYKPFYSAYVYFAIGTERTLKYACSKWLKSRNESYSKSILNFNGEPFELLERIKLPTIMFGHAAIIENFKKYNYKLEPHKIIKKCPFALENETFFAETVAIYHIQKNEINKITSWVQNMYNEELSRQIQARKEYLNIN